MKFDFVAQLAAKALLELSLVFSVILGRQIDATGITVAIAFIFELDAPGTQFSFFMLVVVILFDSRGTIGTAAIVPLIFESDGNVP